MAKAWKFLWALASLAVLGGCGAPSTSYYLDRATTVSDCTETLYYYSTALLSVKNADPKMNRPEVAPALAGVKSTAATCQRRPSVVLDHLQGAVSYLADARPADAKDVAWIFVKYAQNHPDAYFSTRLTWTVSKWDDPALTSSYMDLTLERGVWTTFDANFLVQVIKTTPSLAAYADRAASLASLLGQVAAEADKSVPGSKCDIQYCNLSNGSNTSIDPRLVRYQAAYAAALGRLGQGDSSRARIAALRSRETLQLLAQEDQRRAAYAAQAAESEQSTNAILGALGSVTQMAAGSSRSANAPAMSLVGQALQGQPVSVAQAQYAGAVAQQRTAAQCSKATPQQGTQCCRQEGGTPSLTSRSDGSQLLGCRKPRDSSWGCRYVGGRLDGDFACAVQ